MMSQNPYAYDPRAEAAATPPRTSVLSILSLVTSLLCCIPFLGTLGALMGVVAVFRISGSGGRRTGMGMAIGGIIVGVVVSIIWLLILLGAHSFGGMFTQLNISATQHITAPDATSLKASVNPALAGAVTDGDLKAFQAAYEAELGPLQPPAANLIALYRDYGAVGPRMNGQNRQNVIPLPVKGSKDNGVMFLHINPGAQQPNQTGPGFADDILARTVNISILLPSGQEVYLVPQDRLPALPAPRQAPGGGTPSDAAPSSTPPAGAGGSPEKPV